MLQKLTEDDCQVTLALRSICIFSAETTLTKPVQLPQKLTEEDYR
jgi:hypothetical protein